MWSAILQAILWVIARLTGGAAKPAAPTPDDAIVTNAVPAAKQQGADEEALTEVKKAAQARELMRAHESEAAVAVGDAQRRVVRESDEALAIDPDAHYRD